MVSKLRVMVYTDTYPIEIPQVLSRPVLAIDLI